MESTREVVEAATSSFESMIAIYITSLGMSRVNRKKSEVASPARPHSSFGKGVKVKITWGQTMLLHNFTHSFAPFLSCSFALKVLRVPIFSGTRPITPQGNPAGKNSNVQKHGLTPSIALFPCAALSGLSEARGGSCANCRAAAASSGPGKSKHP